MKSSIKLKSQSTLDIWFGNYLFQKKIWPYIGNLIIIIIINENFCDLSILCLYYIYIKENKSIDIEKYKYVGHE